MSSRTPPLEPKQVRSRETRRRLLDAAVDELIERGYGGLTAQAVAHRAGVSRGAQQNHFPHKTTLVAEAVRHLGRRQIDELHAAFDRVPGGPARERAALDALFAAYSGKLFAAIVELSLAARDDAELRDAIAAEERTMSKALSDVAADIFGPDHAHTRGHAERWTTALSAIRGLALLKLIGHPPGVVDRQWRSTRRDVLALLSFEPS